MKKILLQNGLDVSAVCLGAMNFGTTTSKQDSFEILDKFVANGGNFIDTSNNYAHWAGTGDESETVLGEWIRSRGGRDKIVLATKVGFDRHGKGAGLKKEQIEYWIDESLRKLNTDYIDLYYAHTDDENTPIEETMEAFNSLVKKGKVRVLGGSNYDTWRFCEANAIAKEKGFTPYSVMQQRFSYLFVKSGCAPKYKFNEAVNRERLRYLVDKNIPLVAYSCLCKGGYENDERMPLDTEAGERLALVRTLAKEKGVSASAIVIGWMSRLHETDGFPTVIPLFSSSPRHLGDNLKGLTVEISKEEMDLMNRT